VINLFNQEQIAIRDELYTYDNVNPIVGGTMEDMVFAKQVSPYGDETRTPAGRNIAYGTPLARYTPLYLRVGARLSAADVPVLDEVWPLARKGVYPGGAQRNLDRFDRLVDWPAATPDETKAVLADLERELGKVEADLKSWRQKATDLEAELTKRAGRRGSLGPAAGAHRLRDLLHLGFRVAGSGQRALGSHQAADRVTVGRVLRRSLVGRGRLVAGGDHGLQGRPLVFEVALGRLDEIGDQVVTALELHVDLREGVLEPVAQPHQRNRPRVLAQIEAKRSR